MRLKYRPDVMTKRLVSSIPYLLIALTVAEVRAAEIDANELFRSVTELRSEIEQIRQVIGEPLPPSREYRIHDAVPRHVFYQAQTLFRKSNQFAQQMAGVSRISPKQAPEGTILDEDVLALLNDVRGQLGLVKAALGIEAAAPEAPPQRRKQPSDVLREIIDAGREINFIGGRSVAWATIYDRILLAITYVGGALPEETRYPPLPAHQTGKFPVDVFNRLAECMDLSRKPASEHGIALLRLESIRTTEVGPTAIEVGDVATILLSDLAELTLQMEAEDVAAPEYPHPNRVFPSHAVQLAGVLKAQLEILAGN